MAKKPVLAGIGMQSICEIEKKRVIPFNVPIFLTWLRMAMIPLVVGIFFLPEGWLAADLQNLGAAIIFIIASITDWFDGYLARRWNQTSAFGAFLDPVADKLMVAGALLVLVQLGRVHAILGFIIIGREIAISALREWMAGIGESKSVAVSSIGKIKTTAQMIAIPMLLYYDRMLNVLDTRLIGNWLLVIAATLTVISMLYYLKKAWPLMKEKDDSL